MGTTLPGKMNRVFFGIMPEQLIASNSVTGLLLPPPDVTVALSGAVTPATAAQITAQVQTIGVAALTGPIAKGTMLAFISGPASNRIVRRVSLLEHAKSDDTSLTIAPIELSIAATATAAHKGLIQLKGGKKADLDIKAEDESVMVFTELAVDEVDLGYDGFKTGAIKSKEWSIAYEALNDPTDLGYPRMANAGASGTELFSYCRILLPTAPGFRTGESYEGMVSLVGWKQTLSAESSFISYSTEIKGRGRCIRKDPVQSA